MTERPITDEDRYVYWAVHYCAMAPQDARRLAQEHPDHVDAWNDVRREHEHREQREARKRQEAAR